MKNNLKKEKTTFQPFKRLQPQRAPLKRKDPDILKIPQKFQSSLPKKSIKIIQNKINAFKRPKIIWKNLNKFNIIIKFNELMNFVKTIFKKIYTLLKENENFISSIIGKKEEYKGLYEKLREKYLLAKEQKNNSQERLGYLLNRKNMLNDGKQDLILKIQEIRKKKMNYSNTITLLKKEIEDLNSTYIEVSNSFNEIHIKKNEIQEKVHV